MSLWDSQVQGMRINNIPTRPTDTTKQFQVCSSSILKRHRLKASPGTRCPPGCGWRRRVWAGAAWSRSPDPVLRQRLGQAVEIFSRSKWTHQTSSPGCRRTLCPAGIVPGNGNTKKRMHQKKKRSRRDVSSSDDVAEKSYQSQLRQGIQFDLVVFVLDW